jgi:AcrR family transcriptional regulator
MVQSAATLIRERGIHGTGLREVVAHSGGPRGSLGRFFPGGKTQLVTEAIDVAIADLFGYLERTLGEAETFPEAISVIVTPWRRLLVDHDYALGCPLAATSCDAADNDSLRTHVSELGEALEEFVGAGLTDAFGATSARSSGGSSALSSGWRTSFAGRTASDAGPEHLCPGSLLALRGSPWQVPGASTCGRSSLAPATRSGA